jgi:hypothetical protein
MVSFLSFSQLAYSASEVLNNGQGIKGDSQLEQLFSYSGYPYNRLLNRADIIKINYRVRGTQVTCSVSMDDNELQIKSSPKVISVATFDSEPLVSCLSRKDAKIWLSQTFAKPDSLIVKR